MRKENVSVNVAAALGRLGFSGHEVSALVRLSRKLHRFHERCCMGEVEFSDDGRQAFRVSRNRLGDEVSRVPTRHVERWADVAIGEIVTNRNGREAVPVGWYHQSDPRGCALYIVPAGVADVDCCYASVGVAVEFA